MAYVYSTSTESPFERYWYFHKYTMCKGNRGKELNPKEILILVESANCNNPNTLDTHINVEKNSGMLSSLLI